MGKMRILVANDPCVYREAIAGALRELRPQIGVNAIETGGLADELARLSLDLVVCSRITTAVRALLNWILLYPDGENRAVIRDAGDQVALDNVALDDLLSVIDRIESLSPKRLR